MYFTQEKPYLPLLVALIFLALPLAFLLHELSAVWLFGKSGLLFVQQNGGWTVADVWGDSVVWFICGVFGFLNIPLSAGLTKLAYKKMMRRHFRYALFLTGVAACAAAVVGFVIELVLGAAALGGLRESGVFCYALSVFLLAVLTLPKQLTRAPVQPVVFHKMKR